MGLVNQTLPGLYNGVSQQPDELRLDTQVSEMINCYPSIVEGVQKRPPAILEATDTPDTNGISMADDVFIHTYDRGAGDEQYILVIQNGYWRAYDIEGTPVGYDSSTTPVTLGMDWQAATYLVVSTGTVANAFSMVTVGDTTYVVNKTKTAAMSTTTDDNGDSDWASTFFYWVKRTAGGEDTANESLRHTYYIRSDDVAYTGTATAANASGNLTGLAANTFSGTNNLTGLTIQNITQGWMSDITSNGTTALNTATTTDPWAIGDEWEIIVAYRSHDSNVVARELNKQINGVADTSYTSTAAGSLLKVSISGDHTLIGSDSWGNQASEGWQGKIKKLQDLPNELGFPGSVIEISGDDKNNFDNYYVKYDDGVYKETFKPGLANSLEGTSMPHKLEREEDGTFAFSVNTWDDRKVGDVDSSPEPSFIGGKIEDVFFYKNRLGMISGDSILFSETGEYYNFFPTTVTDVLDSDPIDVSVDSNHAVQLSYAIPFNKELLVFGNKAQFIVSASKALTPKDVNIQQSTSYAINKKVAPTTIGPNVFFATDRNNSSLIREYFVVPDTSNNVAANITGHIPSYIPKGLIKLTGSEKHDMLFAIDGTNNKIYVYNFYWQGEEKAQSAWHTWEMGTSTDVVFDLEIVGSTLLVMIKPTTGGKKLTSVNLELTTDMSSLDYKDTSTTNINSRIEMSKWGVPNGQSNVDSNRTSLTLRDLQLSMADDSWYGIEITRGTVTSTWYNYDASTMAPLGDHKYTVVGNANNIEIALVSNINKGFKLNSLSYRGSIHLRGRGI